MQDQSTSLPQHARTTTTSPDRHNRTTNKRQQQHQRRLQIQTNNDNNNDNHNDNNTDNNEGRNEKWPQTHSGIKIIVDSKQLCDSNNGTAVLDYDNERDYSICSNITNQLIRLHQLGFHPAHKHLDPIEWRSRERNKGADKWCNQVLDQQHNSFHQHNVIRTTHRQNITDNNNNNNNHNNQDNNNNNNKGFGPKQSLVSWD